jgi:hypothetical protein
MVEGCKQRWSSSLSSSPVMMVFHWLVMVAVAGRCMLYLRGNEFSLIRNCTNVSVLVVVVNNVHGVDAPRCC